MKLNPYLFGALVLVVFLGVIFGAQQFGIWGTSGKVDSAGRALQPSASDVDSIKGWMTLEQVAATFSMPVTDILAAFDLPLDTPPSTAIKDLESDTFSPAELRTWLSAQGTP